MSAATDTPIDAKAGWSSYCRREQHKTCREVKARCACSCHGTEGQQPPKPKEPTMPTVVDHVPAVALVPQTRNGYAAHNCPDCGKEFDTAQGVGAHRSRSHGYRKAVTGTPKPRERAATPKADAPESDPWMVVVVADAKPVDSIVLVDETEARQVTRLLGALGHRSVAFRLADAS